MIRPLLFFIFLLVFTSGNGVAQNYDTYWNYDISDGLPTNSNYDLMIDSKGRIWFGSDFGVTCYNGQTFQNYTTDDGLNDNTVLRCFEDRNGRIWFHHNNRLPSYYENGEIYKIEGPKEKLIINSSSEFGQLENGEIYLGCANGYLMLDNNLKATYFKLNSKYPRSIVSGKKNELLAFNNLNEKFHVKVINLTSFLPLARKNFYNLSTCLNRSIEYTLQNYQENANHLKLNRNLGNYDYGQPFYIQKFKSKIYYCTSRGLYIFKEDKDHNLILQQKLLDGQKVVSLKFDYQGNMWLSSVDKGIYFYPNNEIKKIELPPNSKIKSQAKYRNGILYGLDNGQIVSTAGKEIKKYLQVSDQNAFIQNVSLFEDGTLIYDTGEKLVYHSSTENLRFNFTHSSYKTIFLSKNAKYYMTSHSGLVVLDPTKKSLQILYRDVLGKTRKLIEYHGELYIATQTGLYRIVNDYPEIVYLKAIENTRINDLVVYDDKLFISTGSEGIIVFDGKNTTQVSENSGLLSNQVTLLRKTNRGTIWIATNLGLQEIELKNGLLKEVNRFDLKTNLLTAEIVDMDDIGDYLMITTENSLFSYKNNVHQKRLKLHLFLNEFRINSKKIKDTILEAHSGDNLKITTAVPNFTKHPTEYFYRINKEPWVKNNSEIFSFLKLSPGDYELEIVAKSPFFQDSDVQTIRFSVSEKWYQNLFVLINIFSFVILILILFFRRRALKKAEHKRAVLKSELLSLQSQMNPHFTFNSLNSIQSYLGSHDQRSAQIYLADFANLMRTILDQAKLHLISLDKEVDFLKNYLDLEKRRLENQFDYQIIIDDDIESQNTMVPTLRLQPFVENAIWHGVAGLDYQGSITIHFKKVASKIVCEIIDNGQGFEKSKKANTSRPYHKSTGIVNCRERIDLFKEIYHHTITLNFLSPDTKTTGTIVQVSFPHLNLNESRI
ncbi:MAG: histidine kinase [Crocinitomicaceae bacterium]